jgi:hypothetical protein
LRPHPKRQFGGLAALQFYAVYRKPALTRGVVRQEKWKTRRHAGGEDFSMGLANVTRAAWVIGFWKSRARLARK